MNNSNMDMDDSASNSTGVDSERNLFDESCATAEVFEFYEYALQSDEIEFLRVGCKCNRNCVEKFPRREIMESRFSCQELKFYCQDHVNHHHIHLKGAMNALVHTSDDTTPVKYKKDRKRKTIYTQYTFRGVVVCQNFFQFVNSCSTKELRNVRSEFLDAGVETTVHGNTKKIKTKKRVSLECWKQAVSFICRYGIQNGLVLPGRIPSFRSYFDLLVLPSMVTKLYVYDLYKEACKEAGKESLAIATWYVVWKKFCSNVVIQAPKTDLCQTCQNSIRSISQLINLPEDEKKKTD